MTAEPSINYLRAVLRTAFFAVFLAAALRAGALRTAFLAAVFLAAVLRAGALRTAFLAAVFLAAVLRAGALRAALFAVVFFAPVLRAGALRTAFFAAFFTAMGAPSLEFNADLNAELVANRTPFDAGIGTAAPVRGFRPKRAERVAGLNVPKPITVTFCPD